MNSRILKITIPNYPRRVEIETKKESKLIFSINSNKFVFGELSRLQKFHILNKVKESIAPYLQNITPFTKEESPIRIKQYIYDSFTDSIVINSNWDIGNRSFIYGKAFCDLLVKGIKYKGLNIPKLILDDNVLNLTEDPTGAVFCPIDKHDNRRLVFIIGTDCKEFNDYIKELETERLSLLKRNDYYGKNQNNKAI